MLYLEILAREFGFPIINKDINIWFFRTQSGIYYYDFFANNYIALGWDLLPYSLVDDANKTYEQKKEFVLEQYPDEKRPGLILGQMATFYKKMKNNDLVIIPASGGKRIAIGVLGDFVEQIIRNDQDEEYIKCNYSHKRKVTWLKEIDLYTDVYLYKVLRAQQTISNISNYSYMIYRNLHPCYLCDDGLHLTLRKNTNTDFRIKNSVNLQKAILDIDDNVTQYFNLENKGDEIVVKTAVGSPGFIEIILPYLSSSIITGAIVFRAICGKTKTKDGATETGLMAILSKGNELLNDYYGRKKTVAETKLIEAQTRKTLAEAESVEISNEKQRNAVNCIAEKERQLIIATEDSGIKFEKQLDKVV